MTFRIPSQNRAVVQFSGICDPCSFRFCRGLGELKRRCKCDLGIGCDIRDIDILDYVAAASTMDMNLFVISQVS